MTTMTRAERTDLLAVSRKIERVAKADNKRHAAALEAQLEAQLSRIYRPGEDPVWAKLHDEAQAAVSKAQEALAERCAELRIQPEFAPRLNCSWWERGANLCKERCDELRKVGQAKIEAI